MFPFSLSQIPKKHFWNLKSDLRWNRSLVTVQSASPCAGHDRIAVYRNGSVMTGTSIYAGSPPARPLRPEARPMNAARLKPGRCPSLSVRPATDAAKHWVAARSTTVTSDAFGRIMTATNSGQTDEKIADCTTGYDLVISPGRATRGEIDSTVSASRWKTSFV